MESQTNNIELNELTGDVSINGITYRFRPKTFELFRLLSSSPNKVVSKSVILEQIWAGAVVEEQAIFQSINEIRKAFAPVEVIKTYPRKGYAWVMPLSSNDVSVVIPKNPAAKRVLKPLVVLSSALLLLLLALIVWKLADPTWVKQQTSDIQASKLGIAKTGASHQAILVLPFDVSALDRSQHWLKFAGMDALIQHLQPNQQTTVFQLTDVVDILKRLDNETQPEIARLFQVAGLTQIVEVVIRGVPGDYQLIYTLHQPNSQQKHVFHSTSIEQSMPQLAQQISSGMAQQTSTKNVVVNANFQNHLLSNAIELVSKERFDQALPLATSAVALDPSNIVAQYVLSGIQLQLGLFVDATVVIERALLQNKAESYAHYVARLWYNKGVLQLQRQELNDAEQSLVHASKLASEQKDWLYLAYSQSMLAQIRLIQKRYAEALPLMNAALQYQQILHCPLGIAQSELDLATYFMLINQPAEAKARLAISKKLVSEKGLRQLHAVVHEFEQKWAEQL